MVMVGIVTRRQRIEEWAARLIAGLLPRQVVYQAAFRIFSPAAKRRGLHWFEPGVDMFSAMLQFQANVGERRSYRKEVARG
jgi:hypothetical protein